MAVGNRKERRAATKKGATSSGFEPTTEIDEDGVEYILQHPDRSGPKGKTLFDMAEERQRELNKGKPGYTADGDLSEDDEELIGPFGIAFLYAISLGMLHLTLDVTVYSQYREQILWSEIIQRAVTATPVFLILVYLLHVDFSKQFPMLRNIFFLVMSTVAGCYLIFSVNMHGYFFVMKAAPPIGALWVWSVIEMHVAYAVASCVIVLGYLWWNGFQAF
ncbi:hypothetical protein BU24DRAFT_281878 [Aaosphaeria arxii CBS 175.79]|uniref:DUF7719 domain-containing protein n=1 Tax=Aaosphaeria arxii CBS 175.79 TaxID=1450172 RepID=A0A6A5XEY2_9PLEO|nr:uncharacterized protein BU24DRAFT_281878 [Aaosphaeria arxii CBS 175.79]KAF2011483.1 hypothetical protein BU24DRAFT_281878 [Aaosphaeria arxii CBS 175.79]